MIGGVGAVGDDGQVAGLGQGGEAAGQVAHVGEAHLGDEVEVVLVDDDELWLVIEQRLLEACDGVCEHGIEDGDRDARVPQSRSGVERAQGRVRLHLAPLLGVVGEVIGVGEEDVHGLRHWRTPVQARAWEGPGR